MASLPIEGNGAVSSARDLADAITAAVRAGRLAGGDRLPPIRDVARQCQLSATTVSAAWHLLSREGIIETDGRRGTTVAGPRSGRRYRRHFDPESRFPLDVSTGEPDPELLPDLTPILRVLDGRFGGHAFLDEPLLPTLEEVLRSDWPYQPESMTIVNGVIDALELVTRSAVATGMHVVVENPCFPPLLDILEEHRVSVTGVSMDEHGLRPEELEAALRRPTAAIYLQPHGQNPTGITMHPDRADQLADIIRATRAVVVEDGAGAAVSVGPTCSLGRHLPDQTIHIRNFSKTYGGEMRVAAVSGPADLIERITSIRQLGQGWTSRLLQRLLCELLADDTTCRAVTRARECYRERRSALVDHFAHEGVAVGGQDGYNLWLPVLDQSSAMMQAARHGVGVAPGTPFSPSEDGLPHVRVTTSTVLPDQAASLVHTLARAANASSWIRA